MILVKDDFDYSFQLLKLGQLINWGFLDSYLSNPFKVYIKVLTRVRDENLD